MKLLAEQLEDAEKMANAQDLPNFSKAGTGKTHTALEALRLTKAQRCLVLCPKIALYMWKEEATKFLGMDTQIIKSSNDTFNGSSMIVTTYDLAANMKGRLIDEFAKQGAVLINDESHNINNATAKRTKAIFGDKCDLVGSIAEWFSQVWNMTGTPMTGYADGMFTQAALLHPEVFAKYGIETLEKFERQFTFKRRKQYHPQMQPIWKISGNLNEGFLKKLVYQEVGALRRLEAKGLPEIRHRDLAVSIKLTSAITRALKGMTSEQIAAQINDPDSIVAKVWHTVGLLKVSETVPYIGESAKLGPVLVGVWHRDVSALYHTALSALGLRVAEVHGSTHDDAKEHIRTAFNNGTLDVLIGQMKAMGSSWNLQQESAHVIITEEHPSPTVIEQFYKRVYRYGQRKPVQVDYITADAQIDTVLRGIRERKAVSNETING